MLPVSSTSVTYAPATFEVATSDGLEDVFTSKYMISHDIDLRVKATQNVAQYFQSQITYVPERFEVATRNGLGEDALTRNLAFEPRSHKMLPSTLHIM